MNHKTIIIDNNKQNSTRLEQLMRQQMPELQIIGNVQSPNEGLELLQNHKAQLLFVNIADLTGDQFMQLKTLQQRSFSIIFVTPAFMEPLEDCFFDDQTENKQTQAPTNLNTQNYPANKTALEVGCPQTAVILYTPNAATGIKGYYDEMRTDIKNSIFEAVKDLNEAFFRSDITTYDAVEITLIREFNFDNSNSTKVDHDSLKRMAEAIDLKDNYNADFLILITDTYATSCGRATVQATKESAFGIVPYNCMITNLSFAHEIGHLFGAGHDVDNNKAKIFEYNNGYIAQSGEWRTIMSYYTPCGGCKRIPYWSNPDVNHPIDDVPMGTDSLENNARVIRDYNNTLASFGQPAGNFILSNNVYENNNNFYTNIVAKQNISTTGNITVQNEACIILNAGQEVILNNNFEVKTNASLDVEIDESIEDCE